MSSNIRITKTCQYCGDNFIAKTTVTKYCSDTCAKKAYKARKRNEKIQLSDKPDNRSEAIIKSNTKDFLSIKETSDLLGVSRWTVYNMIERKQITPIQLGRRKIIKRTEIDNLR